MSEAKIKACHGCGNPKPEIKTEAPEHNQVRCDRCDTRGPVCTTTEWAIVYWNTLGSRTAGDREPAMSKTAGTKHVGISDLCQEIEMLPASEQETKVVTMAGELQNRVAALRAEAAKQAKCLREQSAECFPEEDGKKHFARLIMESVADELDAAFNPPNEKADSRLVSAAANATTI